MYFIFTKRRMDNTIGDRKKIQKKREKKILEDQ